MKLWNNLPARVDLPVEYHREYGLRDYLRKVVFSEDSRCGLCYDMRLRKVVEQAKKIRADAFTTTLLYSRYQNHELIRHKAEQLAEQHKIPFYYHDFREGWQQGIDMSKEMGLYRQSYCGCIYSEQERYDKCFRKKQEARRTCNRNNCSPDSRVFLKLCEKLLHCLSCYMLLSALHILKQRAQ